MRRNTEELREEMRRNTDRIMLALVSHSHQDGGPPVFRLPPGMETATVGIGMETATVGD